MAVDRLAQVEKNITRLQEQLSGTENALITAPAEDKVRLRQRIGDLKAEIQTYEIERETLLVEQKRSALNLPQKTDLTAQLKVSSDSSDPYQKLLDWLLQVRGKAYQEGITELQKFEAYLKTLLAVPSSFIAIVAIASGLIYPNEQIFKVSISCSPVIAVLAVPPICLFRRQKTKLNEKQEKLERLQELKTLYISFSSQDQEKLQPIVIDLAEKFCI
ncbi:MAG: hypothetical protein ACO31I_09170 [Prochlorotrichaceae cyanobacterium]|jgi:hypothetical protein